MLMEYFMMNLIVRRQTEIVETLDELANSRGASFTIGNPGTDIPESLYWNSGQLYYI